MVSLASWSVPEGGYGTSANAEPLSVTAATALRVSGIERIDLRAVSPDRTAATLESIPLK